MNQTRSEQGAIATIVAILFGLGVIFGVMALAIDVGGLMVERRQLQNGADATSMSLAESCALDNCVAGADGLDTLVDANARDGDHAIASQCAVERDRARTLPGCPASSLATTNCPPLPPSYVAGVPYVEVRTSTREDGQGSMVNVFSRAAGNRGHHDGPGLCARGLGAAGLRRGHHPADDLRLRVADLHLRWHQLGGRRSHGCMARVRRVGAAGLPAGGTTPNTPGHELIITLHDPSKPPCAVQRQGHCGRLRLPRHVIGTCTHHVQTVNGVDKWATIDTGGSATNPCKTTIGQHLRERPGRSTSPVFDCIIRSVSEVCRVEASRARTAPVRAPVARSRTTTSSGWAKFYLSGYKIGGSPDTERASRVSGSRALLRRSSGASRDGSSRAPSPTPRPWCRLRAAAWTSERTASCRSVNHFLLQ